MTSPRIAETFIVKVGVLGLAEEGIGTATVDVDVQLLGAIGVGKELEQAARDAFYEAFASLMPQLHTLWPHLAGVELRQVEPDDDEEGDEGDLETTSM